jgi:hypothetical protein
MSTIKSSNEHLTLNADGSSKDIKFQSNASEKMRINSAGNVGIGTTTIASPENNAGPILQIGDGSNAMSSIVLHEDGNKWEVVSNNDLIIQDESVVRLRIAQAGDITFSDTSQAAKVTIKNDGKVGIGETTPLGQIHIKEGDSGASSISANGDQLVLEDDAHCGMHIFILEIRVVLV